MLGIPPDVLVPGGLSGLVLAGLWAMFTGRIYPGSAVERIERQAAEAIARANNERDEWRELALDLMREHRAIVAPVSEAVSASEPRRR